MSDDYFHAGVDKLVDEVLINAKICKQTKRTMETYFKKMKVFLNSHIKLYKSFQFIYRHVGVLVRGGGFMG